jgi:hypothetical protein
MAASFAEAQQRILALNDDELPFVYEPTPDGVVAHWKYADVKWHGFVSAGLMSNEYELRVVLDGDKEQWTFHETSSEAEASVRGNSAGASKSWHSGTQKRASFQFGATVSAKQTDRQGTHEGHTYQWAFTSDEVKEPVVQTLEAAGWKSGNGFFAKLFGG